MKHHQIKGWGVSERKASWVTIHILSEEKPRVFSPERRINNAPLFQQSLKLAKDARYIATCGCDSSQKLRLYVHTAHSSGIFSLRRFPHTGRHMPRTVNTIAV
jgi:hypothetical protein